MTEQHTPGPWMLEAGRRITTQSGSFVIVSSSAHAGWRGSWVELDANARLIAAAPEMLAALGSAGVVLINRNKAQGIGDESAVWEALAEVTLEDVRKAIDKATKES